MNKIKQKISKGFQKVEPFNWQNWLDLWSKDSVDNFVKNFIELQDKATNGFKGKTKNLADAYFAQKAIQHQASENLPFKTLVLLGQKLNHPAYKEEIEKIIKDNIIKSKGVYYKLNDIDHQKRIQKAIKNYEFDECTLVNKKAA